MTNRDTDFTARLVVGLARQYETVNSIAIKRHCADCDDPKAAAQAVKTGLEARGVKVRGKV